MKRTFTISRTSVRRADASVSALPKRFRARRKTKRLSGKLDDLMRQSAKVRDLDTVRARLSGYPSNGVLDRLLRRIQKSRRRQLKSTTSQGEIYSQTLVSLPRCKGHPGREGNPKEARQGREEAKVEGEPHAASGARRARQDAGAAQSQEGLQEIALRARAHACARRRLQAHQGHEVVARPSRRGPRRRRGHRLLGGAEEDGGGRRDSEGGEESKKARLREVLRDLRGGLRRRTPERLSLPYIERYFSPAKSLPAMMKSVR